MLLSRRQLHALSHDPATLTRAVLLLAGCFVLMAVWLGMNRPPSPPEESFSEKRTKALKVVLDAKPLDRAALLRALREDVMMESIFLEDGDDGDDGEEEPPVVPSVPLDPEKNGFPHPKKLAEAVKTGIDLPALLALGGLSSGEQEAVAAWHAALRAKTATPELIARVASLPMPEAPALPRTMAADLKRVARDYQGALADYEAIGKQADGAEARRRAVDLALSREWREVAHRLMAQPAYAQSVHEVEDRLSRQAAQEQLDIPRLTRQMLTHFVGGLQKTDYFLLSLLTASVWFVSLHMACRLPRRQWWISLVALVGGMFSTVVTLVLLSLQEARNGLAQSDLAGPELIFQIASVGLREESSKLLCVLPVLLYLLRNGTPAQALMAASSAGLGFALEENIGYFAGSGGLNVMGRFITATFMHIGMTGLTGHALFRFLRYPKNYGPAFLATFVCMVLLHGFYNFSQDGFEYPGSRELGSLFPFIVAGLGFYYFQTVREEQDNVPQAIAAHAVFVLGATAVTGILLNYLVWQLGWGPALIGIVPGVLSSLLFCWLFTHFLRNA